ncbi:hypothetical protein OSTOST_03329, partial [Ostertagia ostertagi]
LAVILFLLVSVVSAITIAGPELVLRKLWLHTAPEALDSAETYLEALELCIHSVGIAIWGVMSAASLRGKRGGSYGIAIAMVMNNIIIGLFSLFLTASIEGYIYSTRTTYYYSFHESDLEFYFGALSDVIRSTGYSYLWVVFYNIPTTLATMTRFFPPVVMLTAIFREKSPNFESSSSSNRIVIRSVICQISADTEQHFNFNSTDGERKKRKDHQGKVKVGTHGQIA